MLEHDHMVSRSADEHYDRVVAALRELGVLREDERVVRLHAWNCAMYVSGQPCSCGPELKFNGPQETGRSTAGRQAE